MEQEDINDLLKKGRNTDYVTDDVVPTKDKRWGIYDTVDHTWFSRFDINGDPYFCEKQKDAKSYHNRLHADLQALLLHYEYGSDTLKTAIQISAD